MSGIPAIDFATLRVEVQHKRFTSRKIAAFAQTRIDELVEEHRANMRYFQEFQEGSEVSKDLLLSGIEEIFKKCTENYPVSPKVRQLKELKALLAPIEQEYQNFQLALIEEDRQKDEAERLFLSDCGAKKSQLLRNEQEEYEKSPLFQAFLEKIKEKFSEATRKRIYFAYAWPTDSRYEKESWVQPFLKNLQAHLKKAGFPIVQLDIVSNRYGANIYEFMEGARTSGYVLLFGTESLLDKFSEGIPAVCTELIHILRKREEDGKENVHRVFPILLSGDHRSAFPPEYEILSTIRDWRDQSYLESFQQLFLELLDLPPEEYLPKLRKYWREVLEERPNENPPFSDWYQQQREAVEACRRNNDREELRAIGVSRNLPLAVDEAPPPPIFAERLKEHYTTRSTISILTFREKGKWELTLPVGSLYTKLVMIAEQEREERRYPITFVDDGSLSTHETIFKAKKEVAPEEIFQFVKGKRAVIYGSAGIGKTTFTTMLLHKWAKGELLTEFQTVLCIRLRNLTKNFYPRGQVYHAADILQREYESLGLDRIDCDRNTTLLILDGWDELPRETREGGHLAGAFQELQEHYPNLLITSRPGAIDVGATEFEILGFSDPQIGMYIDRFFHTDDSKAAGIKKFIRQNPLARSLAHIPINLSILCALYDQDDTLFNSETSLTISALYDRIINQFYKIFLLRSGVSQNEVRSSPLLSMHPKVEPLASCLEKIAYNASLKEEIYTDERTIAQIVYRKGLEIEDVRKLGLYRVENHQGSFIHLTFQGYFAALHISRFYESSETRPQALEIVRKIKFNPKFFRVLSMTAGILSHFKEQEALQVFFDHLYAKPRDLAKTYELSLFTRCFDECQNLEEISQYQGFIENVKDFILQYPSKNISFMLLAYRVVLNHEQVIQLIQQFLKKPLHQKSTMATLVISSFFTHYLPREIMDLIDRLITNSPEALFGSSFVLCWIEILGNLGGKQANSFLTMVLSSHFLFGDEVISTVCRAIGRLASYGQKIGSATIKTLIDLLYEDSREVSVRISANKALGEIFSSGQVEDSELYYLLEKTLNETPDTFFACLNREEDSSSEDSCLMDSGELMEDSSFRSVDVKVQPLIPAEPSVFSLLSGHYSGLEAISSIGGIEKTKIEHLISLLSETVLDGMELEIALGALDAIPVHVLSAYYSENPELVIKCCSLTRKALVKCDTGCKIFA